MVSIIPRRAVQSWSSLPLPPRPFLRYPFFPSLSSIPELASTWLRTVNVVDGFPIFLLVFSRAVSVSSIDDRHKRKATISFNVAGYLFSNDLFPCRPSPPSFPARDDPSFYFHSFTSRIKNPSFTMNRYDHALGAMSCYQCNQRDINLVLLITSTFNSYSDISKMELSSLD